MSDVSKTNEALLAKVMDTLAYYQCRANNPKADHPTQGYHAFSEDQRDHLREKQREGAEEIVRMFAATRVPVQGEPECECWPTEEKYHFVHFGATEPGSAFEYNPECPEHGEPNDEPCLGCGSAAEDGHDDCMIKVRTFRATVPDAATAAVERVRAIHQKKEADAVTGDCATESCEHEDKCPTQVFEVCIACWNLCEESDPYFGERGIGVVLWPCPTVAALDGAPEPEAAERDYAIKYLGNDEHFRKVGSLEDARNLADTALGDVIMHRIKSRLLPAGPWLPVEGEKP